MMPSAEGDTWNVIRKRGLTAVPGSAAVSPKVVFGRVEAGVLKIIIKGSSESSAPHLLLKKKKCREEGKGGKVMW